MSNGNRESMGISKFGTYPSPDRDQSVRLISFSGGGVGSSGSSPSGGLDDRERRILALAARGLHRLELGARVRFLRLRVEPGERGSHALSLRVDHSRVGVAGELIDVLAHVGERTTSASSDRPLSVSCALMRASAFALRTRSSSRSFPSAAMLAFIASCDTRPSASLLS
jgi:hypothetical protein